MAGVIKIKGLEAVMANLNKEILKIEGRTTAGLIEGAMLIYRSMDKTSPRIPLDLGNLRASWFTVTSKNVGVGSRGGIAKPFKGKEGSKMQGERGAAIVEAKGILSPIKVPSLMMGFSANYATFVHEAVDANFAGDSTKIKRTKSGKVTAKTRKYTRRVGAGAKFFESAIKRNSGKVIKIIQMNAIIKK